MLVPFAVSGPPILAAVIAASLLLMWLLIRAEHRDEQREEAEHARHDAAVAPAPVGSDGTGPPLPPPAGGAAGTMPSGGTGIQ